MVGHQARIGADRDLDAGLDTRPDRLLGERMPFRALGDRLRGCGVGMQRLDQGRHQELAALDHLLAQLVGQRVAVLDAVRATLDSGLDSQESDRVCGDLPAAVVVRLFDERGDDLGACAEKVGVVVGRGDAARRRDLDDVDAAAQQLAHFAARIVDGVDDHPADQRCAVDARLEVEVGVTARLAEHLPRDEQARAGNESVGDGVSNARVDAHQVAHRRDAGLQGGFQAREHLEQREGGLDHRRLDRRATLRPGKRQVDVAVEEAGGHGVPTEVDPRRRIVGLRGAGSGARIGDLAAIDHDDGVGHRVAAGAIDEGRIVQNSRHAPLLPYGGSEMRRCALSAGAVGWPL
jgi:hypothetical protein